MLLSYPTPFRIYYTLGNKSICIASATACSDYRFNSDFAMELQYLSRRSDEELAALNFNTR